MWCYVLSQRHFPSWNFPSENFANVQFPKWELPKSILAAALSRLSHPSRSTRTHCSLWRLRRSNLNFGKLHIWEVALGKLSLGKSPVEKCLWNNTYELRPIFFLPWTRKVHVPQIGACRSQLQGWRSLWLAKHMCSWEPQVQ